MQAKELLGDERIALCALVGFMMRADQVETVEERQELLALASEIGPDVFHAAMKAARDRFATLEDALAFGEEKVVRAQARSLIHTMLVDMAQSDGLASEEQPLLRAVARMWGLVDLHG